MLGRPPRLATPSGAAAALALGLGVCACGGAPNDDAGDLHNDLLLEVQGDDYHAWARPPVGTWMAPLQPSHAPHGAFVDVYLNEVAGGIFSDEPGTWIGWPDGSIFVLDGWRDAGGTDLAFIAIAAKIGGAWYWEEYLGDDLDRPTYAGTPEICVGCHAAGVDYIRSVKLP